MAKKSDEKKVPTESITTKIGSKIRSAGAHLYEKVAEIPGKIPRPSFTRIKESVYTRLPQAPQMPQMPEMPDCS